MSADDERTARLLVAIRRRSGLTQAQLALRARVPRRTVVDLEAGRAGSIKLERTRSVLEAAGGHARLGIWWNGAAADRLLDEQHAAIVERSAAVLVRRHWQPRIEVSYSQFGERGSIDILAWHQERGALAVCEVKSEIGSLEELNRTLDAKVRLAPKVAADRFGWKPRIIGRILILPDRDAVRRVVGRHTRSMATIYPARSRDVRVWLRAPDRSLGGIWFLSIGRGTHNVHGAAAPKA